MSEEKPTPPVPNRRVRFIDADFTVFPDSRCRCQVTLEAGEDRRWVRSADGTDTQQGRIQSGALACLRAVMASTGGRLTLELRGAKAVRAFDSWVVIVLLQGRSEQADYRLIGASAPPGSDLVQAAVFAVLDATNRILARYLDDPVDA